MTIKAGDVISTCCMYWYLGVPLNGRWLLHLPSISFQNDHLDDSSLKTSAPKYCYPNLFVWGILNINLLSILSIEKNETKQISTKKIYQNQIQ